jgi:regulator of RNase E activity RraA
VILEQERADEIYEASVKRRQRETQLIADLRSGRTTLDLLGLPGLREETETAPK